MVLATLRTCVMPDGTENRGPEVTFRENAEGERRGRAGRSKTHHAIGLASAFLLEGRGAGPIGTGRSEGPGPRRTPTPKESLTGYTRELLTITGRRSLVPFSWTTSLVPSSVHRRTARFKMSMSFLRLISGFTKPQSYYMRGAPREREQPLHRGFRPQPFAPERAGAPKDPGPEAQSGLARRPAPGCR